MPWRSWLRSGRFIDDPSDFDGHVPRGGRLTLDLGDHVSRSRGV
jgi:hypothetical protein